MSARHASALASQRQGAVCLGFPRNPLEGGIARAVRLQPGRGNVGEWWGAASAVLVAASLDLFAAHGVRVGVHPSSSAVRRTSDR